MPSITTRPLPLFQGARKEPAGLASLFKPAFGTRPTGDVVRFRGASIRVDIESPHLTGQQQELEKHAPQFLKDLQATYDYAVKKHTSVPGVLEHPNLSGRCYATTLYVEIPNRMPTGEQALKESPHPDIKVTPEKIRIKATETNTEDSREDFGILCGERSAKRIAASLVNQYIPKELWPQAAVTHMLMTGANKPFGEDPSVNTPCSVCLSVMESNMENRQLGSAAPYFTKDTRIISPLKETDGALALKVKMLHDYLPMAGQQTISKTDQSLDSLPLAVLSEDARRVMKEKKISEKELRHLLGVAKNRYDANDSGQEPTQPKQVSSQMYTSPKRDWWKLFAARKAAQREIFTAGQFDYAARWSLSAEMLAMREAIGKLGVLPMDAIAFYGDKEAPSTYTAGIMHQQSAWPNSLVVLIRNDVIEVRTYKDFLPVVHISRKPPVKGVSKPEAQGPVSIIQRLTRKLAELFSIVKKMLGRLSDRLHSTGLNH